MFNVYFKAWNVTQSDRIVLLNPSVSDCQMRWVTSTMPFWSLTCNFRNVFMEDVIMTRPYWNVIYNYIIITSNGIQMCDSSCIWWYTSISSFSAGTIQCWNVVINASNHSSDSIWSINFLLFLLLLLLYMQLPVTQPLIGWFHFQLQSVIGSNHFHSVEKQLDESSSWFGV